MTENANTTAEQASMDELIKLIEQRAATYGLLSRLFRVEVDQELLDELHGIEQSLAEQQQIRSSNQHSERGV